MKKILLIIALLIPILFAIVFGPRIRKDIRKKLQFENTYAIHNVETGLNVRPHNAEFENGVEIISYTPHDWECITWEFIKLQDSTFLLKNLYTEKTFQPSSEPKAGVGLTQKSMGGTPLQYWEFLKQPNGNYLIRLRGTELYMTPSSDKVDSPIILMPKDGTTKQNWKLIKQTPWI